MWHLRWSQSIRWHKWQELGLLTLGFALALFPAFIAEWIYDFSGVYFLYENRTNYGIDTSLIILLVALALACIVQHLGPLQRPGFLLIATILCLSGLVSTAHVLLYAAPVSVGAIDALLGTDLHEAMEYLSFQFSPRLAFTTAFFALMMAGAFWLKKRLTIERPCATAHGLAYSSVLALVLLAYQHPGIAVQHEHDNGMQSLWGRANLLNMQVPSIRILQDINQWLEYRRWLAANQEQRKLYDYHATLTSKTPRTLVIVLGESMRRGNLSLYGYDKPTTPKLDARKQELLLFRKAIAPANQTVPSVTKLLSPATVQEPDKFLLRPSIIAAAKQAGYKTFWLSNQGRVGQFDSMISLFAKEADVTVYTNTEFYGAIFDDELLQPFSTALEDPSPLKLIIVHLQGSHQDYVKRYPAQFNVFNGKQYNLPKFTAEQKQVMAEYDNSILHTDSVLDAMLQKMSAQPDTVMLYVSDHGERFYESGIKTCGHGYPNPTRNEVEVPFFLWCQQGCKQEWIDAQRQHENTLFSTENLFYSAINLLGLQMQDYDASADILSKQYRAIPPMVITTSRSVVAYKNLP